MNIIYTAAISKAAADITKQVTGENIIWARPLGQEANVIQFIGRDAANTSSAMLATLRGGLSLTFWLLILES
jgi:alpha-D-xyloside xylohydrolase